MTDPAARLRIPRVPGLYWVLPAAVDFPVRVFVHRYPHAAGVPTLELCASGRIVSPLESLARGWQWFADKPDTAPADPDMVAAIARGHRLEGRREVWSRAAASLRDVVRRAALGSCACSDLPTRGSPGWDELQAGRSGTAPVALCLKCSAVAAVAQALEAESSAAR